MLNNWRKHQQDRGALSKTWLVDPFSSGASFWGWKQLEGKDFQPLGLPARPSVTIEDVLATSA